MFTKADQELARVAATKHSIFTLADARRVGLTHGQIDRRVADFWTSIHEGVFRVPGATPTWRGDLLAACLAATRPVAASHRSGAALYELPGARGDLVEITCRRWLRTQKPGLLVHESRRFDERDITQVDGIPVVTPERLVLDLAGIWPSPNFVEKVLQAARRKRLITYESTSETFERHARKGIRGVKAMRTALERWNPTTQPTDSEMETLLVQVMREHDLPELVTQFEIRDEQGRLVARTDAALSHWKITFEYQSKQEHSTEFQLLQDDRRRNAIIAAGYYPLQHGMKTCAVAVRFSSPSSPAPTCSSRTSPSTTLPISPCRSASRACERDGSGA